MRPVVSLDSRATTSLLRNPHWLSAGEPIKDEEYWARLTHLVDHQHWCPMVGR